VYNYTNNFGGTKLKRNYIWGYVNKKRLNTTGLVHNTSNGTVTKITYIELKNMLKTSEMNKALFLKLSVQVPHLYVKGFLCSLIGD
jgi:hypothetical protein